MTHPAAADRVVIRFTRTEDAEALRDLRLEALRLCPAAFSADLNETEAHRLDWWRDLAARGAGDGPEAILVATDGDRLLGMTGVWGTEKPKQAHRSSLWGVYVRPAARGYGLGGRLVEAAVNWARRKGLLMVTLDVAVPNEGARRCYERAGFCGYGVQPMVVRVNGVFYDELLMVKRL